MIDDVGMQGGGIEERTDNNVESSTRVKIYMSIQKERNFPRNNHRRL